MMMDSLDSSDDGEGSEVESWDDMLLEEEGDEVTSATDSDY